MKCGVSDQTRWSSRLITSPSAVSGSAARHRLHQHEGRPQVRLDVRVPARAGDRVPFVALEGAGVVDQDADGPERRLRFRQQSRDRGFVGEVGLQDGGPAARVADLARQRVRLLPALMAMEADREAGAGQGQADGAADPARAAGDQGRPR